MKVILRNPRREVDVAGNRRVKDILRELDIMPETVLVICGDDLVTADHVVRDDDDDRAAAGDVRRRPAGSAMKCRKCGEPAVLELRRHNAAFCAPDFLEFFRNQVREAIRKHRMFTKDETVLVAVSGGKDSLALWDVLIDEGYQTTGLLPRPRNLRVFGRVEGQVRAIRRGARRPADRLGGARRGRRAGAGHQDGHPAAAVLGLRPLEALSHESGGARARDAGGGDGPQPRRRGGDLVRVRDALADRRVASPVPGARRRRIRSWSVASSRSIGCPSARRRPSRSSGRSTTSSRSARSPRARPRSPTRRS